MTDLSARAREMARLFTDTAVFSRDGKEEVRRLLTDLADEVDRLNSDSSRVAGVRDIAAFLNRQNGAQQGEMSMQILKLQEEAGEVAAAWIGACGQNPRKGFTHIVADVWSELADVAITAMVAISRLGGDPDAVIDSKLKVITQRYAEMEDVVPEGICLACRRNRSEDPPRFTYRGRGACAACAEQVSTNRNGVPE